MTSRQGHHKNLESNIQSGSGLPTTTSSSPMKFRDGGTPTSISSKIPMKAVTSSGDIFMTGRDLMIKKNTRF